VEVNSAHKQSLLHCYGDLNGKLLGSILEVLLVLVDQKIEKPVVERSKKK